MSVDFVESARPGEWVETALNADEASALFHMRIPTERYTSREFLQREKESIWLRVWQVAGRADELPKVGDWKEYRILDQSFKDESSYITGQVIGVNGGRRM